MPRHPQRRLVPGGVLAGTLMLAGTAVAAIVATLAIDAVQPLGPTPGFTYTTGTTANGAGGVAGYGNKLQAAGNPWGTLPVRSLGGGAPVVLPLPADAAQPTSGRAHAMPEDMAEDGTVVGVVRRYVTGSNQFTNHAILWDAAGSYRILPPGDVQADGWSFSEALAVSPSGAHVVGRAWYNGAGYAPVRWSTGSSTPLRLSMAGASNALIYDVNDGGVAVGEVFAAGRWRAGRWSADGMTLVTLPDLVPSGATSPVYGNGAAVSVLPDGSVVGYLTVDPDGSGPAGTRPYAVRWSPDGVAADISPVGATYARPVGANADGMVHLMACHPGPGCRYGVAYEGTFQMPAGGGPTSEMRNLSPSVGGVAYLTGYAYVSGQQQMARWRLALSAVNAAPVVSFATNPIPAQEGSGVLVTATVSDPDGPSPLTYAWDLTDDGIDDFTTATSTPSYAFVPNDNGTRTLRMRATDGAGAVSDPAVVTVNVANVAPTATFGAAPATVNEGSSFALTLGNPDDPSSVDAAAGFAYAFDCGAGSGLGAFSALSTATPATQACGTSDNGTRAVHGAIRDKDGGTTTYGPTSVTITNVAPTVTALELPTAPVAVNTAIAGTARYSDPGTGDTHTAQFIWDWDLASNTAAVGAGTSAATGTGGSATGGTTYGAAGVYTVQVAVTDDDGGVGTRVSNADLPAYVVVYDPSAGFVTGGGWIHSPSGACLLADCTATTEGKATFGFVSRYARGATTPSGNTEFQFHAGNLNFRSTTYQWLVISGARAQYKGEGTINGAGRYGFLLTARDGQVSGGGGADGFRIKIWMINADGSDGSVVYDNRIAEAEDSDATTVLGGGSIVIHAR
ncbi:MAG TPA: PKD domain-containing protein [Gemmatimonadaceae bacterium]|nr:PKD domain-containing protein [Gemmatimonadaceae bacterium]